MTENVDDKISKSVQEIDTVTDSVTDDTNQYKKTGTVSKEDSTIQTHHVVITQVLDGLPLSVGITMVVLYHILYITYKAFQERRTDDTVEPEGVCYCHERDKIVYRVITITFIGAWILFLPAFAIHKTCSHFTCTDRVCCKEEYQRIKEIFEKYNSQIEQRKEFFQKEVNDMITTYYLDSEHYNSKKLKLEMAEANRRKNLRKKNEEEEGESKPDEIDAKLNIMNWKKWCSCTKDCGFMFFKVIFILVRLGFRLAIIPLFQLHWLDDYAWNCIFNCYIRDYCKAEGREYFIAVDRSLVVYAMHILILLAILFTVIISWFPRDIPKIVLDFERNFNSLTIRVDSGNDNRK